MKILAAREGRPGVFFAQKENLKGWIKEQCFESIHNFVQGSGPLIGADHDVEGVLIDIDRAERLAVLTGDAQRQNLRHALALIINNRLEVYDIGEIKEEDLEIV